MTATLPTPTTVEAPRKRYNGVKMTLEEFLRLPDDGVEREYLNGRAYENDEVYEMTKRNRRHCRTAANISTFLKIWADQQPKPRGEVLTGEIGVRLRPKSDVHVGMDVAYLSPELSEATPEDAVYVAGVPIVAVEIASPSDTFDRIKDTVDDYLDAGVTAVWILNPYDRTVAIYRAGEPVRLLNEEGRLENESYLPGFAVAVADLFAKS
jgi:Uma2 family endonuclease